MSQYLNTLGYLFYPILFWSTGKLIVSLAGQRIFIHGAAATPLHLIECLVDHGKKAGLSDVEIMHIHTEGPGLYNNIEYQG